MYFILSFIYKSKYIIALKLANGRLSDYRKYCKCIFTIKMNESLVYLYFTLHFADKHYLKKNLSHETNIDVSKRV